MEGKEISAVDFIINKILNEKALISISTSTFYIKDEVVIEAKTLFMQQIKAAYLEACIEYSGTETALQSDIENCKDYINETYNL